TGSYNSAFGSESLSNNTTGSSNVAIGDLALSSNSTGHSNTSIGVFAGNGQTTGVECTFLGYNTDGTAGTYNNATAIGYNANVTASNRVRIGNTAVTQIGGQVSWSNLSDERLKKNIAPSTLGLEFIQKLRPVTYNFIEGHEGILYTGFIAQDVEKTLNKLGQEFSGVTKPENETDFYSIRYAEFVVPLVNAVQEQQIQIEELKTQNSNLEKKVNEMQVLLEQLQQLISK
ncbi:MAG: tail fiber domain-containing protein, partial [Flavobacteriales bacterium]|nr:tail fiber domain-containing protein [Flavobacteriales bacterium]